MSSNRWSRREADELIAKRERLKTQLYTLKPDDPLVDRLKRQIREHDLSLAGYQIISEEEAAVRRNQELKRSQEQDDGYWQMLRGLGCLGMAAFISVVSYVAASNSPTGGTYIVWWGPMLFGVIALVRGYLKNR